MARFIRGECGNHAAGAAGAFVHVVGGPGQGVGTVALGNRYIGGGLSKGDSVFLGLDRLDLNQNIEAALGLGGNGGNLVAGAGLRAAVPHDVIVAGFAPKEADMIVSGIRARGIAPPHEDDVAFLGQARAQQLLLGTESVSTDIAVFDKVFVVGGACQPVVRQAGTVLVHRSAVHDFHGGFRVQAGFAEDVADKTGAVHPDLAAVVARIPVGGLSVPAHIFGTQVEVIVLVAFQLPDNGFTGNSHGSHVVGASLHLGFHRIERVLSVKHRHVAG